jgi:hypothetical protein
MFMEFQFGDIVFGIFPMVGAHMLYAFGSNNSVGDIVNILTQMLEVSFTSDISSQFLYIHLKTLEFIHDLNIAHREYPILLMFY